jgi:hypothetical protein
VLEVPSRVVESVKWSPWGQARSTPPIQGPSPRNPTAAPQPQRLHTQHIIPPTAYTADSLLLTNSRPFAGASHLSEAEKHTASDSAMHPRAMRRVHFATTSHAIPTRARTTSNPPTIPVDVCSGDITPWFEHGGLGRLSSLQDCTCPHLLHSRT